MSKPDKPHNLTTKYGVPLANTGEYERPDDATVRASVHPFYWLDGLRVMETRQGRDRQLATCQDIDAARRIVEALGFDAYM